MAVDSPTAGRVLLVDQAERDSEAVADVRRQARSADSALKPVLNNVASSLDIERMAARTFENQLKTLYARVSEFTRALIAGGDDSRALLVNASKLPMEDLLTRLGMGDMIQSFTAAQVAALRSAEAAARAAGFEDFGVLDPSEPVLRAALDRTLEAFWQEQVVLPTRRAILDAAVDALTATNLDGVAERVERTLDTHAARATTEARTEIARWNRTVQAVSAAESEAELFAYLGPVDGVTRPFCRTLAQRILTAEQISELDNGQTVDSPLTSGGGFNCRHVFNPVSRAFAERSGLPFATDAEVQQANRRAA